MCHCIVNPPIIRLPSNNLLQYYKYFNLLKFRKITKIQFYGNNFIYKLQNDDEILNEFLKFCFTASV